MRDWALDFWLPLTALVFVAGMLAIVGYAVVSSNQGYERWVDKLEAQNGALVCEDSGSQIIRFER